MEPVGLRDWLPVDALTRRGDFRDLCCPVGLALFSPASITHIQYIVNTVYVIKR